MYVTGVEMKLTYHKVHLLALTFLYIVINDIFYILERTWAKYDRHRVLECEPVDGVMVVLSSIK